MLDTPRDIMADRLPPNADALTDPVIEAIKKERAAFAEWRKHSDVFTAAEEAWFDLEKQYPDHIVVFGKHIVRTKDDLDNVLPPIADDWDAEDRRIAESARRALLRRLHATLKAHSDARKECGLTDADDRETEAMTAWQNAEYEVLATKPTTKAGARALINFAELWIEAGNTEPEQLAPAFDALARFISSEPGNAA